MANTETSGEAREPRFVQIASAGVANNHTTQCNWILHALDSDGRIWELDDQHGWREVPMPHVSDEDVAK